MKQNKEITQYKRVSEKGVEERLRRQIEQESKLFEKKNTEVGSKIRKAR